jgi:hypothetical protein
VTKKISRSYWLSYTKSLILDFVILNFLTLDPLHTGSPSYRTLTRPKRTPTCPRKTRCPIWIHTKTCKGHLSVVHACIQQHFSNTPGFFAQSSERICSLLVAQSSRRICSLLVAQSSRRICSSLVAQSSGRLRLFLIPFSSYLDGSTHFSVIRFM